MKLTTENIGEITAVTVNLDVLDAGNTDAFKQEMFTIFKDHPQVALDMQSIGFIDSSGCGTLLSCLKYLKGMGGKMILYGVRENVRNLFELIRLDKLIDIFETKEEAIQGFGL